ncbi:hypothetical protein CISEMA079M_15395 [Citrobacter sedlakii]
MLNGIEDLINGDAIHRQQRRLCVDSDHLSARHRIARRILTANAHRPAPVSQRSGIRRRDVDLPLPVRVDAGEIDFTV